MVLLEVSLNVIINAGIAHGFIFTLLFYADKNRDARFLLSLLLIDLSLIVFRLHYLNSFLFENLGYTFFGSGPFIFLLGPLLFFYLRSIVIPPSRIDRKDIAHFIPFVVFLGLAVLVYVLGKEGDFSRMLHQIVGSPWIFLILQVGYYLIQSRRLVKIHRGNIVERFSNVEGMDVSWLNLIIWVFVLVLFFITIATPLLIHGFDPASYYKAAAIFFSLLLFFIAYKGIQQKIPAELISNNDAEVSVSDSLTLERLKEELLAHMESNHPFLNPELTLTDLAKQVGFSRNQLSQVINTGVGDNFYLFVNKFRVNRVKELIKQDAQKQYTILALANEAGFNSKSSFNSIFKKITGLTPSEYRDGLN